MTTAIDIITDALAENGVVGAADPVSAEDATFCLRKLNQLLQRLSNSRQTIPALTQISVTLTGAESYTIGPTGGVVAARPIRVASATATDAGGVEYPVDVLPQEEYDAIAVKAVLGGPPDMVWYESTTPNGRVYVYPRASGYTLKLDCLVLLASFATTTTDVTLPEGYESLLVLMLADDIAAAYGKQTSQDTRRRLKAALTAVKTTNAEKLYLSAGMGAGSDFQFERGY